MSNRGGNNHKESTEGVAQVLVDRGREALRAGDRRLARRYFTTAVAKAPTCAAAWRGLADATTEPETALKYLQQAQTLAPTDASLRWTIQRVQAQIQQAGRTAPARPVHPAPEPDFAPPQLQAYPSRWRWVIIGLCVLVILLLAAVAGLIWVPGILAQGASGPHGAASALGTDTIAAPPAAPAGLSPGVMPTAEDEARQPDSQQPAGVGPAPPSPPPAAYTGAWPTQPAEAATLPSAPTARAGRWIDINLSRQTLTAYEGQTPVLQAMVSTGVRRTPTPTGQYTILRKYHSVHMSGSGYSLPNVPYAMFFYRGYAIHGTYWHSNFGVPMSHGCVNMRTDQAGWLYNWAAVGTPVVIHY